MMLGAFTESHPNSDPWIPLRNKNNVKYSNVLGIPISGFPMYGNVTFNVGNRHIRFNSFKSTLATNELFQAINASLPTGETF